MNRSSRGMAFVELEGPRELHKCIALHHTKLHGRTINIEKSCGGKNKLGRAAKLSAKRGEQDEAVRAAADRVFAEHVESGAADCWAAAGGTFRDKVYSSFPPSVITKVSKL